MQDEERLSKFIGLAILFGLFGTDIVFELIFQTFNLLHWATGNDAIGALLSALFETSAISDVFWGLVMLATAALAYWFIRQFRLTYLVANPGRTDPKMLVVILLVVLFDYIGSFGLANLFYWITGQTNADIYRPGYEYELTWSLLPSDLFLGVVAAPISEEFLFRGVLMGVLFARGWKPAPAILFSAALFALSHVQYQPIGVIVVFFSGCLLGLLRCYSGGLWAPIIAHALINAIITCGDVWGLVYGASEV